ncbi:hypothetical protein [Zooshikella harenae]|uniref:Uncharacterized protein n=1 Tax=Zooshikella harenae TaxID=2827238 RepID=A0ABS5ZB08_9GAMM|nr:hypothetical protein [Zooshikella harenae]MBU2710943.1 hypothetical protein [Zooshikella harenae]
MLTLWEKKLGLALGLSSLMLASPLSALAGDSENTTPGNEWARQKQAQLKYVRQTGKPLDFCYRQQLLYDEGKITIKPKPGYNCIPSAAIGGGGHG